MRWAALLLLTSSACVAAREPARASCKQAVAACAPSQTVACRVEDGCVVCACTDVRISERREPAPVIARGPYPQL